MLVFDIVSSSSGSRDVEVRGSLVFGFQYGVRIMFYVVYPLGKLLELFQAATVAKQLLLATGLC